MGSIRRSRQSKKSTRSNLTVHIGNQLLKLRQDRQKTMSDVSVSSGLSKSFVCDIENGHRMPSAKTLWLLSNALNVDVGHWFEGYSGEVIG